jgi:protein-serine/threonine kinase
MNNRQTILKRSIEFMRDKLGWSANNAGIASAQARLSGDTEVQSMMELLSRAQLVGQEAGKGDGLGLLSGPMTGPADVDGQNIFEKNFSIHRTESPENIAKGDSMPRLDRKDSVLSDIAPESYGKQEVPSLTLASDESSRSTTNGTGSSTHASPPGPPTRLQLKRTYTDLAPLKLQGKLVEAMSQPYVAGQDQPLSPTQMLSPTTPSPNNQRTSHSMHSTVHGHAGHAGRFTPAAQAIFTTEVSAPWTILAANDLACLVFGVTKAEVRKMGILEVVKEERREWLKAKLGSNGSNAELRSKLPPMGTQSVSNSRQNTSNIQFGAPGGITAALLSKPPSRMLAHRQARTDDGSGSSLLPPKKSKAGSQHNREKSRGVLLCGDVVPIQKRNGAIGAASLWVKEKRNGLIWVLEEIAEDVAFVYYNKKGQVVRSTGQIEQIWGLPKLEAGAMIDYLLPGVPSDPDGSGKINTQQLKDIHHLTARNTSKSNIPVAVEPTLGDQGIRVSSFPHIAGIVVCSASDLHIKSSNSVFCAALFGQESPDGLPVTDLIPDFDKLLRILTEEDKIQLLDGIVIPEHSFRRARALLALRDGSPDVASIFAGRTGLPGRHHDGSEIKIDVQMRVVKSETAHQEIDEDVIDETEEHENGDLRIDSGLLSSEVVFALWITYSRHLNSTVYGGNPASPALARPLTPPHQPSPGQTVTGPPVLDTPKPESTPVSLLTQQLKEATQSTVGDFKPILPLPHSKSNSVESNYRPDTPKSESEQEPERPKPKITDYVILEDMGQGAYGQVKLARYKKEPKKKVVLKYVTKKRILVDTWTRDRKLGTIPLEIHVLHFLSRPGMLHPNIVEMSAFFEDSVNYYIEMKPHGLPGMDLFDYIELRVNMDEDECRSIFRQIASALHHLHTKALVVHRDIKDENVILDGEGRIKVIDFGSAAYIRNGPFDVFVGTIGEKYCPLLPISYLADIKYRLRCS